MWTDLNHLIVTAGMFQGSPNFYLLLAMLSATLHDLSYTLLLELWMTLMLLIWIKASNISILNWKVYICLTNILCLLLTLGRRGLRARASPLHHALGSSDVVCGAVFFEYLLIIIEQISFLFIDFFHKSLDFLISPLWQNVFRMMYLFIWRSQLDFNVFLSPS